jgi:hypothetical protein
VIVETRRREVTDPDGRPATLEDGILPASAPGADSDHGRLTGESATIARLQARTQEKHHRIREHTAHTGGREAS